MNQKQPTAMAAPQRTGVSSPRQRNVTRSRSDDRVSRAGPGTRTRARIALYSHDTLGLGHVRRNLAIAEALAASGLEPDILLISGASIARAFELPPRTDCLTLPAFDKDLTGSYHPRSLSVSVSELTDLRARIIHAAIASFRPDAFVVDKTPRGVCGELEPTLAHLQRQGHTRCVLGLREVLDSPAVAMREWHRGDGDGAVRDHYDAVWIYGDKRVYDPVVEYRFSPLVATKTTFTGYIARRPPDPLPAVANGSSYSLCWVGGGADGYRVARAFAAAPMPDGHEGVILPGPFMSNELRSDLAEAVDRRQEMRVLDFVEDPRDLLRGAASVVSMGGYNSVCELVSFKKRALVVPRVKPRVEQLIRAERMSRLGLLQYVHPDDLSPTVVGRWLRREGAEVSGPASIDMAALDRIPALVGELLQTSERLGVARAAV
jgi:predicted glycosyltransferase